MQEKTTTINKENYEEFLKDISDLLFPDLFNRSFFSRLNKIDDINRKYFNDRFTITENINIAVELLING